MNKLELLETRKSLLLQASQIVNRCKLEKRELLKVEDQEFQNLINKISKIDEQISDNKQEKNSNTNMKSFLRFLKNSDNEAQNSLRNELRKYGLQVQDNEYIMRAGSPTNGEQIIPTEVSNVEEQLAELSFINVMGGNAVQVPASFVIPTLDGMSLSWEEEDGDDTTATAVTINPTKLELKRLSGAFALDKKLVDVAAPSLDGAVSNSIYSIIDEKVNEKLIGSMSGATLSATAGTTNFEKIVEAEGLLKDAKVRNIVYLYNPKDLLKLKAVSKKTNELPTSIIDADGKIGGYSTFASSYVPQGAMYAVNPQACWSNIAYVGLISDEYTLAHKGQNRVCVNVYGDAAVSNMAKNVAKITLA